MEKVQEELEEAKAEIEKLQCNLNYKECIINQLSSTNDAQRVENSEKLRNLEENKRAGVENGDNSPTERMLGGGDLVQELEDKTRKLEDEFKWKVEQFRHLEEAHEKLRDQLSSSRNEWDMEKSSLVDEISRLQTSLDDGQSVVEGLKSELAMVKQALENEESKRKRLEGEVSEMKMSLESGTNERWEGKMEMECSTAENGDEEIADLRHSLRVKEMEYKDVEYKAKKLEKENQEILASLKELQEAQIPRAVPTPSSWAKLRGKLKSLEQIHRDCAANLKAKEAEWRCQSEKLSRELNQCSSSLKIKDGAIEELKKELDDCNCNLTQLKMQNEELSLMLQLLRSEVSESECDKEGGLIHLMGQLEKAREEKLSMIKELEEATEKERQLRDELQQVNDVIDTIDSELTDVTNQGSELEYELQRWISLAERLKMQFDESQEIRKELEDSLIAQAQVEEMFNREAEEKDRRISNLEQQILLMDEEIRIGEDDEDQEYDDEVVGRDQDEESLHGTEDDDEDDRLHLDLLARELELAILAHITEERTRMHQQSLQEDGFYHENMRLDGLDGIDAMCSSKENADQQNWAMNKTVESTIDERSPFRVLN
ncbi:hypothetical protein RND81_13G217100 [Saponaria officinalis]|uniref:Uncharacterized protein n=1 Tax=Saponaria officinalis TaxID=3572 RepID=A0AAW1H5V4_SAPOF